MKNNQKEKITGDKSLLRVNTKSSVQEPAPARSLHRTESAQSALPKNKPLGGTISPDKT